MPVVKVVYLDFDGVLHPSTPKDGELFSRAHLLEPLFVNSTASIIISSSWRFTHSIEQLKSKLPASLASRVVEVTGPAVIGKHARYQEIISHAYSCDVVIMWRALDDSHWEFPSGCKELIRCNPNTGIQERQVLELQQWLNQP
jgi:hypothetical protein